jgi:hypothetical protein
MTVAQVDGYVSAELSDNHDTPLGVGMNIEGQEYSRIAWLIGAIPDDSVIQASAFNSSI